MIFVIKGGSTNEKNKIIHAISEVSPTPVYRRSVMHIPMEVLRKSKNPHGAYISEVFKSYIGNVLSIEDVPFSDCSSSYPGDDKSEIRKKPKEGDVAASIQKVAISLTTGLGPLFLFHPTLKKIPMHSSKRHHVFVDLQYEEELKLLEDHVQDDIIFIMVTSPNKDLLLPAIDGLTLISDETLEKFLTVDIKSLTRQSLLEVFEKELGDSKKVKTESGKEKSMAELNRPTTAWNDWTEIVAPNDVTAEEVAEEILQEAPEANPIYTHEEVAEEEVEHAA